MQGKNHFSIIGTGAVGGYYGGLLHRAGFDVHFLLNQDFDYVREYGLRIDSINGNFNLPNIQTYNDPKKMPKCDVVIVALKTTANTALPDILPHLIKDDSVVLTLQNGMGSDDKIATLIGAENVLGGLCFLCSNKVGSGHIRHLDYGLITIGEYRSNGEPGGITPRLEKIGGDFMAAGIPMKLVKDLALARWKKLVWNIPFNGLSVTRNVLTDELVKDPSTRALCETLMNEVACASAACSRPIEPAFIQKMLVDTERMKPYATSMKLDYNRGNPMELEAIYEVPIHTAEGNDVIMPETKKLYQQLCAMNPLL
ncbi:MAG: putative 2-dehydropantoate 2-reductase [Pontiella sp.]